MRRNLGWLSCDRGHRRVRAPPAGDTIGRTARDGIEFELRKRDFAAGKARGRVIETRTPWMGATDLLPGISILIAVEIPGSRL